MRDSDFVKLTLDVRDLAKRLAKVEERLDAEKYENDRLRVVADECVHLLERDKLLVDWKDLLAKLKGTT